MKFEKRKVYDIEIKKSDLRLMGNILHLWIKDNNESVRIEDAKRISADLENMLRQ